MNAAGKAELLSDFAAAHHALTRGKSSKSLVIGLDAAQKAWTLYGTPVTAWNRAIFLDALIGGEIATEAWQEYLQLDSSSPWAEEACRKSVRPPIDHVPSKRSMQDVHLRTWANAVLGKRGRTVGVPTDESSECIDEARIMTPQKMGRKLIECVPRGVTFIHQDLDSLKLHTWVIRDERAELTTTSVSGSQVAAEITRFRDVIADKVAAADLRSQAESLYDILLSPVQAQTAGTSLLVYSPSANLRGLPVTALHDGARFLIETRPIVTTPTISTFTLDRR